MSATLGVNLSVACHESQGDRKYMEDFFVLNYEPSEDNEYAFFGIFDGHGGKEAALFAKEHLMKFIVSDKRFGSQEDDDVLKAITSGFLKTHHAMWREQVNWPKTSSGLPSTSGTTASIAFIRRGKIYVGHVGDTSIVLGYHKEGQTEWIGKALTKDHKPEDAHEVARIESCGGKVVAKSGVPRVVWNRPHLGHKGPVRRSTPIEEIPFLAVARSLGDLWSYNSFTDDFVVSPHPDVHVIEIDVESHRCLIFGTDGLWNMLNPQDGVQIVQAAEQLNEKNIYSSGQPTAKNPSMSLVDKALRRWRNFGACADNTSAVTLLFDPPGVQRRAGERLSASQPIMHFVAQKSSPSVVGDLEPLPSHWSTPPANSRVAIFTQPSSVEQAPAPIIPQSVAVEASKTSESNRMCEALSSTEPTPVTTCQPLESHDQASVDKLLQAVGRLEDDLQTSDEENKKTGLTVHCVNRLRPSDDGSEENNAHSCPTSRRKKEWIQCSGNAIGRVKQARPSVSIRSNTNFVSGCDVVLSRDCTSEHTSSRVLRSDTHSAMAAHTLRSQSVDLKASRLSIYAPPKFTPKRSVQLKAALEMTSFSAGSSSLLPTTKILVTSSSISKRHRQSFGGRTRSVTTRSRVKRLSN